MNKRQALIVLLILGFAGCASPYRASQQLPQPAPEPAPEPETETAGLSADPGGIEEVVVTGSRVDDRRAERASRSTREAIAARRALSISALQDGMPADAIPVPLSSDEELWVIATPASSAPAPGDGPGSGAMLATPVDDGKRAAEPIPMPLQHTAVEARIDGYLSTVHVRQQFANPFDRKIEATYLFPLPEKAAVSEFLMIIGERRIRGILREKEEAEAIYNAARAQGYQASLLVQHRPNVFEQKVANIEPGHRIDVDIQYFHTLAYVDGWYSFVFPTVVGPRYNPPGLANPITPVPRGTAGNGKGVTAPYLKPGERTAHDISIAVELDAGVGIEELESTHEIATQRDAPGTASVQLAAGAAVPNRDFVLRYRVAGERLKSNLLTHWDDDAQQGYFTLMLYPPAETGTLGRQPMELVFVLDCSGSMRGRPLAQAKQAINTALDELRPDDTFQIIRFSERSTRLGTRPLPATRDNLRLARQYLASLEGTGGTQMIEGVKAALDFPHDPSRLRFVSFMTDGYIGNDAQIIGAVHDRIGASRIFSFGVGSSVNRYLLERMAKEGRGAVAYLGLNDSAKAIMDGFFERISHPALTDVEIDWGAMSVSDVYPARIPDLFVGRAVVVTGKYIGRPDSVGIRGNAAGERRHVSVPVSAGSEPRTAIAKLWARLRIADLNDRLTFEPDPNGELAGAIKATALAYQLVSDYTSFVAVDTSRRTDGDYGVTVPQPLPVPDGVRYDTTVGTTTEESP